MRRMRTVLLATMSCFLLGTIARGQDRPLRTTDAETVPAGTLRAQIGFDFLQSVDFPLSGLSGDLTSVGVTSLRLGVGNIVEVELEGTIQNFLDVKSRGPSFVPVLKLTGTNSTHDTGDYAMSTKVRMLSEGARRPAMAMRFGFVMPNSNEARGIGTNSTNVYAFTAVEKHIRQVKVFGNLGLEILQAPNALFTQNDVMLYGGAFSVPVGERIHVVGEVAGRYSSRNVNTALIGTESQSQARFGLQILAGGFTWDIAGIAGINAHDPRSGFTFGVSKDIKLFGSKHAH